jgi:hypothetical protein
MFTLGTLRIGDDLCLSIGDRMVQLRPDQGLRAVEALLRASTRRMMTEEAESAASDLAQTDIRAGIVPRPTQRPGRALLGVRSAGTKPASGSRRG